MSVATVLNGEVIRENLVANMIHSPAKLVSFHAQMMPLFAGDIISTGTPGAAVVGHRDVATARIDGLAPPTVDVRRSNR